MKIPERLTVTFGGDYRVRILVSDSQLDITAHVERLELEVEDGKSTYTKIIFNKSVVEAVQKDKEGLWFEWSDGSIRNTREMLIIG
jgi:hypothetical protein